MTHDYILTHSGARVSADAGTGTIADLALGLSRMPRFAGQTRIPYTVLDHALFAMALVHADHPTLFRAQLAVLLHDAHEALTADVPSPFKPEGLRDTQRLMDARIGRLVMNDPGFLMAFAPTIHRYDQRALLAEAYVVGPPVLHTMEDVRVHFGGVPETHDVTVLESFVATERDMDTKRRVFCAMVDVLRAPV